MRLREENAGLMLASGEVGSGLVATWRRSTRGAVVSAGGGGGAAAEGGAGGAVAIVAPGNSDSGIWWTSETDTTLEAPPAAV